MGVVPPPYWLLRPPEPKQSGESWTSFVVRMEADRTRRREWVRTRNPLRQLLGWILRRDLTPEPPPLPRAWVERAEAEKRGETVDG